MIAGTSLAQLELRVERKKEHLKAKEHRKTLEIEFFTSPHEVRV